MTDTAEIPLALKPAAEAARAWANDVHDADFALTGVVDTEAALAASSGEAMEFGVVLCDGELCLREQVRVTPGAGSLSVERVDTAAAEIPALLDPPEGVRRAWLDAQLAKHSFILLLFYRGRW